MLIRRLCIKRHQRRLQASISTSGRCVLPDRACNPLTLHTGKQIRRLLRAGDGLTGQFSDRALSPTFQFLQWLFDDTFQVPVRLFGQIGQVLEQSDGIRKCGHKRFIIPLPLIPAFCPIACLQIPVQLHDWCESFVIQKRAVVKQRTRVSRFSSFGK